MWNFDWWDLPFDFRISMASGFTLKIVDTTTVKYDRNPESIIGQGYSSRIFKGKFKGQTCAVKQYHASSDIDDLGFWREVNALSALNHENIIKIMGYYVPPPTSFNQNRFLVMELAQLDLSRIIYPYVSFISCQFNL